MMQFIRDRVQGLVAGAIILLLCLTFLLWGIESYINAARQVVVAKINSAINTRLTDEVLALGPEVVGAAEFAAAQKQKTSGGASLEKALGLVEWLISPASDGISGRLIAAPWDPWSTLDKHAADLAGTDIYTLRRITPEERGRTW